MRRSRIASRGARFPPWLRDRLQDIDARDELAEKQKRLSVEVRLNVVDHVMPKSLGKLGAVTAEAR